MRALWLSWYPARSFSMTCWPAGSWEVGSSFTHGVLPVAPAARTQEQSGYFCCPRFDSPTDTTRNIRYQPSSFLVVSSSTAALDESSDGACMARLDVVTVAALYPLPAVDYHVFLLTTRKA
ncbi:hypothetical protein IWX49DRAFT_20839 [Phyllosticta citricarpa]